MGKLVMPNLQGRQMGQVIATLTVTNRIGQVLAERGFITPEEVRFCTLDDVLVDTGATMLCLPTAIIRQLGLVQGGGASIETTAGVKQGKFFGTLTCVLAFAEEPLIVSKSQKCSMPCWV